MEFFSECQTIEEAKSLYKKLARENHPDIGGELRTMQEINAQFAEYCAAFANTNARDRQRTAHESGKKSAADYHDLDQVTEEIRQMIEFALSLEGVDVELMGLWVWLTGNTKAHKEAIKAQGFRWAQNKSAWYYAGVPTFNRQKNTLDEIRSMHGSKKFSREERNERVLHA